MHSIQACAMCIVLQILKGEQKKIMHKLNSILVNYILIVKSNLAAPRNDDLTGLHSNKTGWRQIPIHNIYACKSNTKHLH